MSTCTTTTTITTMIITTMTMRREIITTMTMSLREREGVERQMVDLLSLRLPLSLAVSVNSLKEAATARGKIDRWKYSVCGLSGSTKIWPHAKRLHRPPREIGS
mmetsp:Transcript_41640/g.82159  ORF Transcript_41640/g.82159 Transcript_41640/m.82159 type:complete len:104 (-) Transcript_41640:207-518(-)